ncbi:MAG TPA: hypothetical protein VK581_08580 [Chthoniobacterales bacterium]|nr:hypothetical protein [Chthoniobacterales bacterium]
MLIRTLGLFWREDHVYWGRGRNPGSMLGVPVWAARAQPTDFRDQIGVYALYADYDLVYVGQVGRGNQTLFARLKHHRKDDLAGRWNRFSWFGVRRVLGNNTLSSIADALHPELNIVLDHIEAILIHAAEPPMNGQGGRFGGSVTRYKQVRDERLGPTDHEMLTALCHEMAVEL